MTERTRALRTHCKKSAKHLPLPAIYDAYESLQATAGITRVAKRCSDPLKVERLHGQHFETVRQAKDEALDWLLWYNQTRLHSTLNYVSPMQYEQNWARDTAPPASLTAGAK